MAKRELLKLPGTFEEALGDLLKVKPPEKGEKVPAPKQRNPAVPGRSKGAPHVKANTKTPQRMKGHAQKARKGHNM